MHFSSSNSTPGDNILKDGSSSYLQLLNAFIFIFKEGLKFNNGAWWELRDLFTLLGMIYESLVMEEKMTAAEGELLCTV